MTNVQTMQDLYGEWLNLAPELEKSLELWQKAGEISQQLSQFYTSPEWRDYHENFDQSQINFGENHSVLSEDALWNVLDEQRQLNMKLLKLAVTLLDK
ncbi:hypothetical protein A4G18_02305 [Pasteurellaceae bacterium Pebbles2]|nr:hypothetical protein [Pasteurellaceae bacterium Pebbles2]